MNKGKQKDEGEYLPPPPTQRTLLEHAVQRVDDRIKILENEAEQNGADIRTLLNTDTLLKKLEENRDALKPQPIGSTRNENFSRKPNLRL